MDIWTVRLASITNSSNTQAVTFNANTLRDDLENYTETSWGGLFSASGAYRLDNIEYTQGTYCKQFNLSYDYFIDDSADMTTIDSKDKRLRLLQCQEQSCLGTITIPPHTFDYHGKAGENDFLPNRMSRATDHWGFYNGQHQNDKGPNTLSIPAIEEVFIDENGVARAIQYNNEYILPTERIDKESRELEMTYGTLKRITYPTGGMHEYEYEANEYYGSYEQLNGIVIDLDKPCIVSSSSYAFYEFPTGKNISNYDYVLTVSVPNTGGTCAGTDLEFTINVRDASDLLGTPYATYNSIFSTENYTHSGTLDELFNPANIPTGVELAFELVGQEADVKLEVIAPNTTVTDNRKVGGLRIAQTTVKPNNSHGADIVKTYEYLDKNNNSQSSGVLYDEPKYWYATPTVMLNTNGAPSDIPKIFFENSRVALSSFNGHHIGYGHVREIHQGGNGSKSFEFFTEEASTTNPFDFYPQAPLQFNAEAGNIDIATIAKEDGVILKSTNNSVYQDAYETSEETMFKAVKIRFETNGVSQGIPGFYDSFWTSHYYNRTRFYRLASVTEILDGVTTTTNYEYGNTAYEAPTATEYVNSDSKTYRTELTYSRDISGDAVMDDLVDRNMIASPIKTEQFVDGVQVNGSRIDYDFFNGFPRPDEYYEYRVTWDASGNRIDNGWELETTISAYQEGFPSEIQMDGWQPEYYTWQDGLLQQRNYENFTWDYTYHPSSRLLSKFTDIDGQEIDYTYDALIRPDQITARSGNVVTDLDYFYQDGVTIENRIEKTVTYGSVAGSDLDMTETIQYMDGIGRPIQVIEKEHYINAGGNSFDVASSIEYDNQGRAYRQYEPYNTTNNTGAYSSTYTNQPFTTATYEPSPLNRTASTTPPNWHATTYAYDRNTSAIGNWTIGVNYNPNELYCATTTDPNGNKTIAYTDKKGRTVLSQRSDNSGTQTIKTYQTFDDKGRPKYTYPPNTNALTPNLIFSYLYDDEDNLIEKKVPDAAATKYVYDERNLQVGMQNGILQANNQWYVTQNDNYGREIESGYYNSATAPNPLSLTISSLLKKNYYDTYGGATALINKGKLLRSEVKLLDDNGVNNTWINTEFTYDQDGRLIQSNGNSHINPTLGAEAHIYTYDYADNIIADNRVHTPNNIQYFDMDLLNTYDHEGRMKTMDFSPMGAELGISKLNYTPKDLVKTRYIGQIGGTTNYLQKVDYAYNAQRWLVDINDVDYYPGGSPCRGSENSAEPTTLKSSSSSADLFRMSIDYDNIDGGFGFAAQMNGNISQVTWKVGNEQHRTYGYDYDYLDRIKVADFGRYACLSSDPLNPTNTYSSTYSYDDRGNITQLDRQGQALVGGVYETGLIDDLAYEYYPGSNQIKHVTDASNDCILNKYINQNISGTELHSAIQSVQGDNTISTGANVTYQAEQRVRMDIGFKVQLGAEFTGQIAPCDTGNNSTTADVLSQEGFQENSNLPYTYDSSGNMTYDPNKDLNIEYNHFSLPFRITSSDGLKEIKIQYDANGAKLSKEVISEGNTLYKQDYVNGVEYRDNTIEAVYHSEGRIVNSGSNANPTWEYQFHLKDYLVNNRIVFRDNGSGQAELLDHTDYYAFGMSHAGNFPKNTTNKYQFGGKEFNSDFDWNALDFGARWYDATLGRWNVVDPLSSDFAPWSPYSYTFDNPIRFIDPDGKAPFDNYYRNAAGDIVMIERTGDTVDNFYTVSDNSDGQSTVTFDVSRNRNQNGWNRLTDSQKNYVVNKVDRSGDNNQRRSGTTQGSASSCSECVNGDAVTNGQTNALVRQGEIQSNTDQAGTNVSSNPARPGVLGFYGNRNGGVTTVTNASPQDPGRTTGAANTLAPQGSDTPPTPTPGTSAPLPDGILPPNQSVNILGKTVQTTDSNGNNLLGDTSKQGKGDYNRDWDY